MVDVGDKPVTAREAVARGRVRMSAAARRLVRAGALKKGDAVQTARLAGIMAAKRTSTLIPLCHPLPLAGVDVTIVPVRDGYAIESRVRTVAQTGVEMEALTAVSVAALTLYDMVKAVDRTMTITDVELVSKRGGQSGDYRRTPTRGARRRVPRAAAQPGRTRATLMATLADLPARIAARGPRPALVRRCGAGRLPRLVDRRTCSKPIQQGAAGLLATGLAAGDRLAIVSESRPEWILVDLAAQTIGVVTVPIYPTLPAPQVRHILADSGARLAIVSDRVQAAKVQEVRHLLPALELVVIIDPGTPANAPARRGPSTAGHLGLGTSVIAYAALLARGRDRLATDPSVGPAIDARRAAVGDESLATIIYTSGTTGEPKGVMLTHRNIVSNAEAVIPIFQLTPDDVALTFLPLSHSFERTVVYAYLMSGLTIVFAENLDTIARDLRATAPTLMTVVPRVCEKLQARVLASVAEASAPRRWLFQTALARGAGPRPPRRRRAPTP